MQPITEQSYQLRIQLKLHNLQHMRGRILLELLRWKLERHIAFENRL